MSLPAHSVHYTYAQYLVLEESSNVKHEYLDGQIYAMAGGTPAHARVSANVARILGAQLAGKRCAVYSSDLRVRVLASGLGTYPDVTVVCGRLETDPHHKDTAINPTVLVEVLSPSTEDYDRLDKFEHYRRIPSLCEYVLVSHDEQSIEVRRRGESGEWSTERATTGGRVTLTSLGCELSVDDVYHDALAG